jgi:hypothetical protein
MKRRIVKSVLVLGVIFGLGFGIASVCRHGRMHGYGPHEHSWHGAGPNGPGPKHHWGRGDHREQFEQRVAEVCTQAALKVHKESTQP